LAGTLPQLQSLTAKLRLLPDQAPLLFPPQLQLLSVFLVSVQSNATDSAVAPLTAIGQLQQLHTLHLWMRYELVSLAPLQQLPLLRDLELQVPCPNVEQLADELRLLPCLHRLHVHTFGVSQEVEAQRADFLRALLRDTPEARLPVLQWRDFAISNLDFTDELTPLLLRLPSLERFKAHLWRCTRFDFLAALPQLTHLEWHLWGRKDASWATLLALFVADKLTRLRTLHLYGGPCGSDDMVKLLSHTPSLTNLRLCGLVDVPSLSFFLQLPKLAETLTQLTVECWDEWRLTAADLPPLFALQQLRVLRLLEWPCEESDMTIAAAPFEQRPCAALPNLEVFQWTTC
jgi:hypothetical protein